MDHRLCRAALVVAVLAPAAARADWPVARHDMQRTGAATGRSNLTTPAPYWRQYLGGTLGPNLARPLAVGGNLAYVGGGRLHALSPQGVPRWQTDNLELRNLVGETDLDGDGKVEVVARSSDRAFVFDELDGALRWAEPVGEMGTLADVRLADVDGRPGAELIVQECGCCQIRSNTPGVVYSFADGFASPHPVWTLPLSTCGRAGQMLVADVTGDGRPEFVLSTLPTIGIYDGATGAAIATSPNLGDWVSLATCEAHDVLAGGGAEVVCWLNTAVRASGTGHRVFVLQYRAAPARLEVAWSTDVGAIDANVTLGSRRVVDLDHDGRLEVIAGGVQADGTPMTVVLDATTGAVLTTIAGQQHIASLAPTATTAVLVTEASHQLIGWTFTRAPTPQLTLAWRLKDRRVLMTHDPALAGTQFLTQSPVLFDANGDGVRDLATVDIKRPNTLDVYDPRNPNDTPLVTWQAGPDASLLAGWLDGDHLTVSTSDGRLTTVMAPSLTALGSFRAGQYYDPGAWLSLWQAPVAAQLTGDAAAEVVVTDSRQTLLALDARNATNADPPHRLWDLPRALAPTIVPDLDGFPGVMCRRRDPATVPATDSVARLDSAGAIRWETNLGGDAQNDVVVGRFDGDATPDVAVQWVTGNDLDVRTVAMSGADGHVLWTQSVNPGPAKFPSGLAVTDWNGDGRDDVVYHHYQTWIYGGASGAVIANGTPGLSTYMMPTVVDLDNDGSPELLLSGGFAAARSVGHDLTSLPWVSNTADRPYPYGAIARCGGTPLAVLTSLTPGVVRVIDPAGPGELRARVLAGGQVFADADAATAAGAKLGQLASPVVHANLTGAGRASAVIGSSDGWLYAIDPCTGALDFAVPFGAPVGGVAIADTDDDGNDDLLVSVGDGYLYGVKNAPLRGPGAVRDVAPDTAADQDIDEVDTYDTLAAAWDPVPGATGYEVAIARADGGYVQYPPWQPATGTRYQKSGLMLEDGGQYVVSVRATTATGRSPDILSDGVLVHKVGGPSVDAGVDQPDAGTTGTSPGGCCSTGTDPIAAAPLVGLVAVVLRRRRRR